MNREAVVDCDTMEGRGRFKVRCEEKEDGSIVLYSRNNTLDGRVIEEENYSKENGIVVVEKFIYL